MVVADATVGVPEIPQFVELKLKPVGKFGEILQDDNGLPLKVGVIVVIVKSFAKLNEGDG